MGDKFSCNENEMKHAMEIEVNNMISLNELLCAKADYLCHMGDVHNLFLQEEIIAKL